MPTPPQAYALVADGRDQFGKEALDTLIKLSEDHRDDLVVTPNPNPSPSPNLTLTLTLALALAPTPTLTLALALAPTLTR